MITAAIRRVERVAGFERTEAFIAGEPLGDVRRSSTASATDRRHGAVDRTEVRLESGVTPEGVAATADAAKIRARPKRRANERRAVKARDVRRPPMTGPRRRSQAWEVEDG